ncbi:MAG TPA: peptidylprolyl isomerase [Terriglobia bacterium]|nr:peptidylprolyl isomerase [Terriglobia bacterium]
MKKLMLFAMLLAVPAAFAQEKPKLNPGVYAHFETSMGNFTAELYEKDAPVTVANFIGLASGTKDWKDPKTGATMKGKPIYDGLIFHRIIEGFMIQGGDPMGTGFGGPGFAIKDEIKLKHEKAGALAMANSGPNSAGSQFYITVAPQPGLDSQHAYTVFGQVTTGLDVILAIGKVRTGANDRPVTPVTIKKVTIERVK